MFTDISIFLDIDIADMKLEHISIYREQRYQSKICDSIGSPSVRNCRQLPI